MVAPIAKANKITTTTHTHHRKYIKTPELKASFLKIPLVESRKTIKEPIKSIGITIYLKNNEKEFSNTYSIFVNSNKINREISEKIKTNCQFMR
ncbi:MULTISPECIES: hypothetical protein [unclassified Acinetobacter]|uniref:hypothetical protein n=1 Tax=unclassified Acinetobacter TaxID=196816 RepID=UPI0015D1AA1C|nr:MULTISPECIES: hypothetical protein [unclassified Acinetobacter]